ncbi:immunoglobulin superfamily member 3 [Engraulis encrasicolus]|uniref:immunoglobulin superfamily member 3 n=1 Tax=Engraulis encrasicolus TaxID=184585 RepID=UPI002FD6CC50
MGFQALIIACSLIVGLTPVWAKRVVTVQGGPLVRTEGSHATIWCNVTGYREGVEQDFEWSMYLPSAPDREIRIVSTAQPNYAYAIFAQRVNAKEIWVERLSGDSALLHIAKLEARDQGLFECYTPNTDGQFLGSYSARTNLTVIPDTLSVSSAAQTLSKVEGETLQLTCEVSRSTSQHTHLAVGWYLRPADDPADTAPRDIVTLSRDFVLRPGSPYRQRLSSGDLRLDKTGANTYRLTIYKLQPADQGAFYCEASEWIQDPDKSWYAISRKQSDKTSVRVQPTDRDFSIQVTTERRAYTAGEPLELRCTIEAQRVPERFFSVSWVFSSSPVAVVGPDAVPTLGAGYAEREALGQLTVRKESANVHLLKLQRLLAADAGKYICRVTEREKTLTGDFIDRSKRSRNVQISVTELQSNITASLSSNSTFDEGDPIILTCSVQNIWGSLSVSWQLIPPPSTTSTPTTEGEESSSSPASEPVELASVGRDGTVRLGPTYLERGSYGEVRATRERLDTYTLALYNAYPSDAGQYRCTVTEWIRTGPEPNSTWQSLGDKMAAKNITVKSVESSFFVSASSRTPSVTFGDSFDLQCIVKPRHNPSVPATVTWRFQPANARSAPRDIVTFTRAGTLRWGEKPPGLGTRTTVDRSETNTNFRLSVTRAGRKEAGTYHCAATLYRRNYDGTWAEVANRTSNLLGISVLQPVSKLRVQRTNQSVQVLEDSRVRLNCSVAAQTAPDSQLAVLWYARRARTAELEPPAAAPALPEGPSPGGLEPSTGVAGVINGVNGVNGVANGVGVGVGDPDELLLRIERSGAFEYGAYAEEERLRSRLQAERPSPRQHSLTLHRTETSDSATYYCLVEEWMTDPDGAWYRVAREASGFTHLLVKRPEARLQVEEAETNVTVPETGSIRLGCSIPTQSSRDSRFSVSWYVIRPDDAASLTSAATSTDHECVFSIGHDAVFGNGNCSPAEPPGGPESRLQFERTTSDLYTLTLQRARPGDAGGYYCHVEEWLLNPRGAWYRLATNNSDVTIVNIQQKASSLQSVVCSNDSLFYFVFFYPFPIFGILLIAVLLVRYRSRSHSKSQEGKNGAPLLWIKEPHLSYSPTCLDPPALSLHPGSVE